MQSPSSSSSSATPLSSYPQSSLDYSNAAAAAAMHHHPQSVFDHHLHYSSLHHHHSHHPQVHHPPPQHHYHHPPPPPPPPSAHHHHHLKRDHEALHVEGSSDEDNIGDVKPPGLSSCSSSDTSSLRGGRGSGLKSGDSLSGGKKTKGRVKIKMEFIDNKLRRYTTFSKRKTGIMKKAYELSTLTGTQVMLLVASETGHVYTFATRKLQPMITSDAGKALIQTCLNSPDPSPLGGAPTGGDQRMSATGYEETELTYNVAADEESQKLVDDEHPTSGTEDEEEMMEDDEEPVVVLPPPLKKRPPRSVTTESSAKRKIPLRKEEKGTKGRKKGRGGNGLPKIKVPLLENLRYPLQIPTHASTKTDHISRNEGELADTPLNMVTSYITSHPPHPSTSGILKKEIILKPPKSDSGG